MAKVSKNGKRGIELSVLLTENELAAQFLQSFAARSLPEKFFYWFPLSVRAWLDLCSDGAYRNFQRSYGLIAEYAHEIVSRLPESVEIFSLGCGQGNKDALLLQAILESGKQAQYLPVDSSQALLEMACQEAMTTGIPCSGWKADLKNESHLRSIDRNQMPRLHLILGNTLGAFSPVEFCRSLFAISKPGDLLLVDGEIQSPQTIAGYDNPLNRRFAFAPLAGLGITAQDGKLVFESGEDAQNPGLYYLKKHFLAKRNFRIMPAGTVMDIEEGERLEMNFSCKYDGPTFLDLIRNEAAFQPVCEFTSDDEKFLMVLGVRSSTSTQEPVFVNPDT